MVSDVNLHPYDWVTVIMLVIALGLSVDYSAHIGGAAEVQARLDLTLPEP